MNEEGQALTGDPEGSVQGTCHPGIPQSLSALQDAIHLRTMSNIEMGLKELGDVG